MKIGSVYLEPSKGIISLSGKGASKVISKKIKEMSQGAEGLTMEFNRASEGIGIDKISSYMRKKDLDAVIAWKLGGKIIEEPSLLWQGMAYMDLEMEYYSLKGTRAQLQDTFFIKGERLPIQDLDISKYETEKHLEELAEKLVSHWNENGADSFLRSIIE